MKFRTMKRLVIAVGLLFWAAAAVTGALTRDPAVFVPLALGGLFWALPAVVAQSFTYLDPKPQR